LGQEKAVAEKIKIAMEMKQDSEQYSSEPEK
jgi:hypothetical protein